MEEERNGGYEPTDHDYHDYTVHPRRCRRCAWLDQRRWEWLHAYDPEFALDAKRRQLDNDKPPEGT